MKEYIGANPALKCASSTTFVQSKLSPVSNADYNESDVKDEFYDAISTDSSSSDDEESDDDALNNKVLPSLLFETELVLQFNVAQVCLAPFVLFRC